MIILKFNIREGYSSSKGHCSDIVDNIQSGYQYCSIDHNQYNTIIIHILLPHNVSMVNSGLRYPNTTVFFSPNKTSWTPNIVRGIVSGGSTMGGSGLNNH